MPRPKFALLIDSDNVSAKYIPYIMNELTTRHGDVTYRRIYGDWTSTQMTKWKDALATHSLTPMQQFQNTTGKNATDSFMIIDAMDMLYEGKVDGFCIVSSDSDFTRLASRLRDAGCLVVGMGEKKTPRSFRAACTVFTTLELLVETVDSEDKDRENGSEEISKKELASAIADMVSEASDEITLAGVGSRLVSIYPDFDVRSYGYTQLSKFLGSFRNLELERRGADIYVNLIENNNSATQVIDYVRDELKRIGGDRGISLGKLGQDISNRFPNFNVRESGYAQLSKFLRDVPGIAVGNDTTGVTRVYLDE